MLNALCGRAFYGETTGTIRINGHEALIEDHKDATGFVPQDDIVHGELTVKENLLYSGRFSLPRGTSMDEIEAMADSVLANLGLSRVADSTVGDVTRRGVSGGEKKRVNIGVELMSKPDILFLDEPTSGLDASSALLVMGSLKNLVATQGVTILSVIHQPRKAIFDAFDSLILLGVGGNMVYNGPTEEAEIYFAGMSPPYYLPMGESLADWLIDVSSGLLPPNEVRAEVEPPEARQSQSHISLRNEHGDTFGNYEDPVVNSNGPSNSRFEYSIEKAKERREGLYQKWIEYERLQNASEQASTAPKPYALPEAAEKPNFTTQFLYQVQRNVLISWRNRASKVADTTIIVGAVALISWFEKVAVVTLDYPPDATFAELVEGNPFEIPKAFPSFFAYAIAPTQAIVEYGMKIGVITAVLLALTAAKPFTSKRLEFFRESGSGWDINGKFHQKRPKESNRSWHLTNEPSSLLLGTEPNINLGASCTDDPCRLVCVLAA